MKYIGFVLLYAVLFITITSRIKLLPEKADVGMMMSRKFIFQGYEGSMYHFLVVVILFLTVLAGYLFFGSAKKMLFLNLIIFGFSFVVFDEYLIRTLGVLMVAIALYFLLKEKI